MSGRITMYGYLAERVPSDVHFVLNKYGKYRKSRNAEELTHQIKDFVRTNGENGLRALAEIHPDRSLIEMDCDSCKTKDKEIDTLVAEKKDIYSNFTMNSPMNNPMYYNAIGGGQDKSSNDDRLINKMSINAIIVGGFVLMGVALMLKTQKK